MSEHPCCQSVYFTAPRAVTVVETPLPVPAAEQLLVATIVSAISPGTEMLFYRGQLAATMQADATIGALAGTATYPIKYGYAAVGRVIAVGADLTPHWLDRLVFAFHPHESHFLATPEEILPLPAGLACEAAAFLPNMESAVNFVMDGQPLIGERVAVIGQGVVGLLTTALLARFPLAALVTFDQLSLRRSHSLALGATAALAQADGMEGFDLVYELSGNPAALDMAIGLTGFGGRVVIGSWYGEKRAPLDLGGYFHRSRMQLISSQVSTLASALTGRWDKARRLATAWQLLAQVNVAELITQRYNVASAAAAYTLIDQQPDQTVQVLLTYGQNDASRIT